MTSHQAFYGIPTQGATATAGEDWGFGVAGTLAEPGCHDADDLVTKGRTSLLSPLSLAAYMSAGSKNDGLALQADKFRYSQPRLDRNQEQGSVPTPDPGRHIRRGDKRVDLIPPEVFNRSPFIALAWNRQYPVAQLGATWLLERDISEKGMDCRQARVPSPCSVRAFAFEVIEELTDKGRVQIAQR